MNEDIGEVFRAQQAESQRQQFQMAMENARNTMRAVRIMVQEGDYDHGIDKQQIANIIQKSTIRY